MYKRLKEWINTLKTNLKGFRSKTLGECLGQKIWEEVEAQREGAWWEAHTVREREGRRIALSQKYPKIIYAA